MPGNSPLSRTLDQALYESYSQGRAHTGGSLGGLVAQWSAVNDSRTCDFCDYSDLKIFEVKTGAWDPPVHWGCRCLIAYIRSDEFQPDTTWGDGPPDSAFPPGTITKKPPEVPPGIAKAKEVAAKWQESYGRHISYDTQKVWQSGTETNIQRAAHNAHKQGISEIMEAQGQRFFQTSQDIIDTIFSRWSGESSQYLRNTMEALTRGTADDVIKAMEGQLGRVTPAQAQNLIEHWEAHRLYVTEVSRLSPIVDSDGFITLYRGVQGQSYTWSTSGEIYDLIAAGRSDFSIGARFVDSWSTDINIAYGFAESSARGFIMERKVLVDDLLGGWFEHPGLRIMHREQEMVWANFDGTMVGESLGSFTPKAGRVKDIFGGTEFTDVGEMLKVVLASG